MAAPHSSASPAPGPSRTQARDLVADALYNWCRKSQNFGHVFNQNDLLSAGVIPNRDLTILLTTCQNLVDRNLFKIHDFKNAGGLGWELISEERAANYAGLDRNERMVFSVIDTAGNQGIWTKTIKNRLTAHAKVLERVYKNLESRGLIKPMKSVQNPNRKMYIISTLQPSEDATGGAWYTDGQLDEDLMEQIAGIIELRVAERSWVDLTEDEPATEPINGKRKTPHDGFDAKGKGKAKAAKIDDNQPRSTSPEPKNYKSKSKSSGQKTYGPHHPGYEGYPTLQDISRIVDQSGVVRSKLPENAIKDLLEVMVYDDRLFKMHRPVRDNEVPDDVEGEIITMYRCFKNPAAIKAHMHVRIKVQNPQHPAQAKAAKRQLELEDVGRGGTSEVPCLQCPAFDLCGDGGPVNVNTCKYYDEWFIQAANADLDADDPWPGGDEFIKEGEERKARRLKALTIPAVGAQVKVEIDLT